MPESPTPPPRAGQTTSSAAGWTPLEPGELGRLLPEYEILSLLGRGGMGAVYYAVQKALDRPVALKLLPLELSAQKGFAERFQREARAMGKLSHPNIVALYEFGSTSAGHLFFTMEFVEGSTLADLIHGPGLNPDQALAISGQICLALAYAHAQGVVHRDMKPSNILMAKDGQVKIADFGLARLLDPSEVQLGHTLTGSVMGTPDYMAPEQKRGLAVDHRADIYSLGVMLYEMLCRQVPQGAFAPPSRVVKCDAGLDRIVDRAMQPAPERRYQSTTEMKVDMDGCGARSGPTKHASRWLWSASVVALLLAGVILWLAWSPVFRWWRARGESVTSSAVSPTATAVPAPVKNPDRVAAEWLLSVGGKVGLGPAYGWREFSAIEELPEGDFKLDSITLDAFGQKNFRPPRAEDYQALSGLTGLRHVWFRQVNIADESLDFLRNNPGLRHVQFHSLDRITGTTLEHLARASLEKLDIMHCPGVRSDALARFPGRETIKKLTFVGQKLDDPGVAALREFRAVESLNVYGNPVTDEGLRALAGLPKLTHLYLHECPNVTGTAFADFAASNQIEYVNLRDAGATEQGCAALARLTSLRELDLSRYNASTRRPPLADAGLAHLAKLTNLKQLNIVGSRVTPEGVRAFREAVPACEVER